MERHNGLVFGADGVWRWVGSGAFGVIEVGRLGVLVFVE